MVKFNPPLTYPKVIESKDCELFTCWQVIQSFNIPELSLEIDLSLQVILGSVIKEIISSFVIKTYLMRLRKY